MVSLMDLLWRPAYGTGHGSTAEEAFLWPLRTSLLLGTWVSCQPHFDLQLLLGPGHGLDSSPWPWVGVGHGHGPLSGAPVQDDIVSTTVFEIKAVTEPSQRSLWK